MQQLEGVFQGKAGQREGGSHAASTRTWWCCTIYSSTVNIAVQIITKHSTSCAGTALVQLHKAEMEGKSIQFGAGEGREKAAHAEKASSSPLHLPHDPIKVFGAKVSTIFFGKKENSLQKCSFAGCHVTRKSFRLFILQQCCDLIL